LPRLTARIRVWSLANRLLAERVDRIDAPADATTSLEPLASMAALLDRERLVLVRLELADAAGRPMSSNTYWQSRSPADQHRLDGLAAQALDFQARAEAGADGTIVSVRLRNGGTAAALAAKLTLLDAAGARVLPVYYDDNYVTLLPGEIRRIDVRCPPGGAPAARVALRGWNVLPREVLIEH
jgi:hypothetical protein